jgi:ankyrin repeat protein
MDHNDLFNAVSQNDKQKISQLLDAGTSINSVDPKTGNTPLHIAVLHNHITLCRFLLEHGAEPTAKNNNGETAHAIVLSKR